MGDPSSRSFVSEPACPSFKGESILESRGVGAAASPLPGERVSCTVILIVGLAGGAGEGDPPEPSGGAAVRQKCPDRMCAACVVCAGPPLGPPEQTLEAQARSARSRMERGADGTRGKRSLGNVRCLLGMIWGP